MRFPVYFIPCFSIICFYCFLFYYFPCQGFFDVNSWCLKISDSYDEFFASSVSNFLKFDDWYGLAPVFFHAYAPNSFLPVLTYEWYIFKFQLGTFFILVYIIFLVCSFNFRTFNRSMWAHFKYCDVGSFWKINLFKYFFSSTVLFVIIPIVQLITHVNGGGPYPVSVIALTISARFFILISMLLFYIILRYLFSDLRSPIIPMLFFKYNTFRNSRFKN